jgi:guanosine-3',5'-bis(diphosphate) 3'-pyrophosphohydrolase
MAANPLDLPLILHSLEFAAEKHRGQVRKDADATPYIQHPIALATLLWETGIHDAEVLAAAILHDTIEDTQTTHEELEKKFNRSVADLVAEVSDDKRMPKADRKQKQIDDAPHKSSRAALIKLADKISNLRDIARSPPPDWSIERRRQYFDWARAVVKKLPERHPRLEALFDEAYAAKP